MDANPMTTPPPSPAALRVTEIIKCALDEKLCINLGARAFGIIAAVIDRETCSPWPLGTTALLTTPAPEAGECDGFMSDQHALCGFGGEHRETCPQHPRNAMVLVLPGLLAGLKEKPEGLVIKHPKLGSWTKLGDKPEYWQALLADLKKPCAGVFAYAIPRHVLDQIEAQKGGDEICSPKTPSPGSNAAPANVQPVAGSGPTDGEMLDWYEKNWEKVQESYGTPGFKFWSESAQHWVYRSTLRLAITAAMKGDK